MCFYIFVMVHFGQHCYLLVHGAMPPHFRTNTFFGGNSWPVAAFSPHIPPLKHVTLAANTSQEKKERRKERQESIFLHKQRRNSCSGKSCFGGRSCGRRRKRTFLSQRRKLLREGEACERSEGGAFSGGFFGRGSSFPRSEIYGCSRW